MTAGRGGGERDRVYTGREASGGDERADEEEGEARTGQVGSGGDQARGPPETIGAGGGHRCLCRDASRGPDHFSFGKFCWRTLLFPQTGQNTPPNSKLAQYH